MDDGSKQDDPFPSEADVDRVLAEFDGDPRAAIKALLHDVESLAADFETSVSRGFIRTTLTQRVTSR